MDMTLVVMAAGLGSRYGGVKQIERLGPDGEILMEYAIYDALRAGFDRIVLIIKPSMLEDVRALFGDRIEQRTGIRIDYAFQTPDRFTAARPELAQRKKPLGTVHAVLCARDVIRTPFAVINADDFYGRGAIDAIAAALIFRALGRGKNAMLVSGIVGEVIMVLGYFAYASTILGKGLAAAASIPGNIVQGVAGIAIGMVLAVFLLKVNPW